MTVSSERERAETTETRERVLLAAIADLQDSIRANDTKCSAALVVHGLLFAGTVGVAEKLAPVFVKALPWQRIVMLLLVVGAAACFLVSVYFLLSALRPYRPHEALDVVDAERPGLFFPLPKHLGPEETAWTTMKDRLESLRLENVTTELTSEVTKLAYVLRHESDEAKKGYAFLGVELAAVLVFLILGAAVGATQAI